MDLHDLSEQSSASLFGLPVALRTALYLVGQKGPKLPQCIAAAQKRCSRHR